MPFAPELPACLLHRSTTMPPRVYTIQAREFKTPAFASCWLQILTKSASYFPSQWLWWYVLCVIPCALLSLSLSTNWVLSAPKHQWSVSLHRTSIPPTFHNVLSSLPLVWQFGKIGNTVSNSVIIYGDRWWLYSLWWTLSNVLNGQINVVYIPEQIKLCMLTSV